MLFPKSSIFYGEVLELLGDISGRGSLLGQIGLLCEVVQNFVNELDCYHVALLLWIRVRHALMELAFLYRYHLAVQVFILFGHVFQKFFLVHLFSRKLAIFSVFLVILA